MRIVYLITIVALLLLATGCRSSRSAAVENAQAQSVAAIESTKAPVVALAETSKPASEEAAESAKALSGEAADHGMDFWDATTWLLGDISPVRFINPPHSSWYLSGYKDYQPDPDIMAQLRKVDIDGYTITIVLGSWCPDSRREVPRFMKIADMWGFPKDRIRFIGVDINKIAPLADYQELDIDRVPTFIFYKNNSEVGRIIEVPVTSLEQDTRIILTGK